MQILLFILVLAVLVLFHEWGHFTAARKLGVGVLEFGFGFPPRLYAVTKKGIEYTINALPLGGFVRLKGEDGENNDPDSFLVQPRWKKAVILFAGVFMNWVLAILLFSTANFLGVTQVIDEETVGAQQVSIAVLDVVAQGQAAQAGLQKGDEIISVNNSPAAGVSLTEAIVTSYEQKKPVTLEVGRAGEVLSIAITPTVQDGAEQATVGLMYAKTGRVAYSFLESIRVAFVDTGRLTVAVARGLFDMIAGLVMGQGLDEGVSGPIGIARMTGEVASRGFSELLQFMGLLSVNLAVLNLLPFPSLDGGRLLFVGIESIIRRKIPTRWEGWTHALGFVILMVAVVLISVRDIMQIW